MPDYSACANPTCERRLTCARYRMKYGHWQSIGGFHAEGCTHYIEVDPKRALWGCVSETEADKRVVKLPTEGT